MEKEKVVKFGDLISKARKEKDYSLQQVSDLLNHEVTPSYMSRLENKKQENPSFSVVCELIKVLDIPFHEALTAFGFGDLADRLYQRSRNSIKIVIKNDDNVEISMTMVSENNFRNLSSEKESLEEIIRLLLQYVHSESESHYGYLPKILEKIESVRQNQLHRN